MARSILALLLVLSATPVSAQWWWYVDELEYAPTVEVAILAIPGGNGPGFAEARAADGTVVDATIRLRLVTDDGTPLAYFPVDAITLAAPATGGMVLSCPGQDGVAVPRVFIADGPTDSDGWTSFSQPLSGGGWAAGPLSLNIYGDVVDWYDGGQVPPFAIRVNSPDLNGDHQMALVDLVHFSEDYFGAYQFRSDLVYDGSVNLADINVFAHHYFEGLDCGR